MSIAELMELADMQDLGSCEATRVGSNPTFRRRSVLWQFGVYYVQIIYYMYEVFNIGTLCIMMVRSTSRKDKTRMCFLQQLALGTGGKNWCRAGRRSLGFASFFVGGYHSLPEQ